MDYNASVYEEQITRILENLELVSEDYKDHPANEELFKNTVHEAYILSEKFTHPGINIAPDQEEHFKAVAQLLRNEIEIQKRMIDLEIKKIDPKPAGIASKISNLVYDIIQYYKRKVGYDSNDESILMDILKSVLKPIYSFLAIFSSITPDKWRVATTKERFKLILGAILTAFGIGCIIAAIVLGVTTPMGIVTGIGVTVVYGSIALGIAAVFSLAIGGTFLGKVAKAISERISHKQELLEWQKDCDTAIQALDNKIASFNDLKKTTAQNLELETPRRTAIFSEKLQKLEIGIEDLKSKLENKTSLRT